MLKAENENFRIVILSTPKTGNTWLSRLLSSVYNLPQLGLLVPFDRHQARGLGDRWVLFHHFRPCEELLDWIDEAKPVLVTTIRHPADVLVSLYYHLRAFEAGPIDAGAVQSMLSAPYDRRDIVSDAGGSFKDDLECSLSWVRTRSTHIVRYEDLWRDVRTELIRLTSLIAPVSERRIDLAIERSDFSLMRRLAGGHGRFFRSGKVGVWPHALPEDVQLEFKKEPYLSLMNELGYSMDPDDPVTALPRIPRPSCNPFVRSGGGSTLDENLTDASFDNGVSVAPLLIDLYLAQSLTRTWEGDPSFTGKGSFHEWLNQPCELPGLGNYSDIVITNLAFKLYLLRPDLTQTFPDLQGESRADFADWFVRGGAQEVELDPSFIDPVRLSLFEWATARTPEDHESWAWWPKLTNFAMHLYRQREDLRAAYPDILCFDRWSYLEWIVSHQQEANMNADFVEPIAKSLKKLAKLRSVGRYMPFARVRVAGQGHGGAVK